MGALLSRWDESHPIALLGLDSSGKTTFMLQAKTRFSPKDGVPTRPTIGFDIDDQTMLRRQLKIFDMGGQEATRKIWLDYVSLAEVVIYLVDITDPDRWSLALDQLTSLLLREFTTRKEGEETPALRTAPILILYNKCDLVSEQRLKEALPKLRALTRKKFKDLYEQNPLLPPREVRDIPVSLLMGWGGKEVEQTLTYYLYMYYTPWWLSLLVPGESLQPSESTAVVWGAG